MSGNIIYQGEPGAFSQLACQTYYPDMEPVPTAAFSRAFAAVRAEKAELAMIPVDNSVAGRVSDIYHLLPDGGLHIIGEQYLPVHHQLLGVPGAKLSDIKEVKSHPMALGQVRRRLEQMDIRPLADTDTAGAARKVAAAGDKSVGAIASTLAAETYGLEVLAANIEDATHNTTRFLVLSKTPLDLPTSEFVVTSLVFKVRSVPSALYKALGGFATNGLNITKLESYMVDGSFNAAQFYMDVEGHPGTAAMTHALDELKYFSERLVLLGTYPANALRRPTS